MSSFTYVINGNPYAVTIDRFEGDAAEVTVNGVSYEVAIQRKARKPQKLHKPAGVPGTQPQPQRMKPQTGLGRVEAPLPGRVHAVLVKEGATVEQGQGLFVLEAMKMENEIASPIAGVVEKILVTEGQGVLEGELMLEIDQ